MTSLFQTVMDDYVSPADRVLANIHHLAMSRQLV